MFNSLKAFFTPPDAISSMVLFISLQDIRIKSNLQLLDPLEVGTSDKTTNITTPTNDITPNNMQTMVQSTKETVNFLDSAPFINSIKSISHSPKISPSSIPNPSPSVTTKQIDSGFSGYGSYLYSIPGYSAFQPVGYQNLETVQNPTPPVISSTITQNENKITTDFIVSPSIISNNKKDIMNDDNDKLLHKTNSSEHVDPAVTEINKPQTDFEEQFIPEIIPSVVKEISKTEVKNLISVKQGACANITYPAKETLPSISETPVKAERFSLKTSIPISKIDIKSTPEVLQNSINNINNTNPIFCQSFSNEPNQRVEIHSNIVIKNAVHKSNVNNSEEIASQQGVPNTNITTLINAAEALNNSESAYWKKDEKTEEANINTKETFTSLGANHTNKALNCNQGSQMSTEKASKLSSLLNKVSEPKFNDQKNQILFIQNKISSNPKVLWTVAQTQTNSQVVLKKTNNDAKIFQSPSRLLGQCNKINETRSEATSRPLSKVVALKRLHLDNGDENDFENLITENQIYGNKIVIKEKSQGIQQEQSKALINKNTSLDKINKPPDAKNIVIQPNFLYVSNLQFPANLMMIKNNTKFNPNVNDSIKVNTSNISNENGNQNEITVNKPNETNDIHETFNRMKAPTLNTSKEVHVVKSSNSMMQNYSKQNINKSNNVIMNSQIVYQVPMIVDGEMQKLASTNFVNKDYQKLLSQSNNNKDPLKAFPDQINNNDKIYIACPYQVDAKFLITNIRSKVTKVDEISSLDIYEKRRRTRRIKYLSNRDLKDVQKGDNVKKVVDKLDNMKNVITPDKIKAEIYKEFATTKVTFSNEESDSDGEYGRNDDKEYEAIISEYNLTNIEETNKKVDFLSNFKLATIEAYKDKELQRQERMLRLDSVAAAYISAGRLDRIGIKMTNGNVHTNGHYNNKPIPNHTISQDDNDESSCKIQQKMVFLSHLQLTLVSARHKKELERVWTEIVKDKRRRHGSKDMKYNKRHVYDAWKDEHLDLDTNEQLQMLIDIKNSVTENNNLIKKRFSYEVKTNSLDSIHELAEKSFTELNRLSKLADSSVKMFSGQDISKRDLTPGMDNENIKRRRINNYDPVKIKIPDVSKIISPVTTETPLSINSSQATSMDEPRNSAREEREAVTYLEDMRAPFQTTIVDSSSQTENAYSEFWPEIEQIRRSYSNYATVRKKEIAELQQRNLQLRTECSNVNRAALRDCERTRALLAQRNAYIAEENNTRASTQRLLCIIDLVRNN